MRYLPHFGVFMIVLTMAGAVNAAVYLVDPVHPAADDAGPGTEDKPWKSLEPAISKVVAGDIVWVGEGEFPKPMLKKSGKADGWITFRSVPGRKAKVAGVDLGKTKFVRIQGFHLVGSVALGGADDIELIENFFDGAGLAGATPFKDNNSRHYPTNIRIAYNEMRDVQQGMKVAGHRWVLESNEIRRLLMKSDRGDADYTRVFGNDHVYRYNFFHGTKREEIGKAHIDVMQFFDNNGEILNNLLVHDNVFFDFHQGMMATAGKPDHAANCTFTRNIYWGGPWSAWGLNLNHIPGVKAERNTFYEIKWFGVGIRGKRASEGIVRNNLFHTMSQAINTRDNEPQREGNLLFKADAKAAGENNKVEIDPMLVDPAAGNFRLQKNSPAIKAGVDGEDIGALEYPNVYWVDPRHPAASDDGFGYAGRPYRTVAKALEVAQEGETIILRGGTYRETVKIKPGVNLRVLDGETARISCADLIDAWERRADGSWAAPLAAAPKLLLRDGQKLADYQYDAGEKKLVITHGDPRIHEIETVVRPANALPKIAGLEHVNALP
jgi:hypothetical protein